MRFGYNHKIFSRGAFTTQNSFAATADDCSTTIGKRCSFLLCNYVFTHTNILRFALILKRQYSDSAVHNEKWIFHYYFCLHAAVCNIKQSVRTDFAPRLLFLCRTAVMLPLLYPR